MYGFMVKSSLSLLEAGPYVSCEQWRANAAGGGVARMAAERQGMNRSELVREAAKDYIREKETEAEEERERKIFHRHKRRLKKQTTVLIREQAKL